MAKIGIIGASGFVGRHLASMAHGDGHGVVLFSRTPRPGYQVLGDDLSSSFESLDAVVNLAGEPVLGLWTAAKRRRILESRIGGTRRVVDALLKLANPPLLINASAIGYYGDTGEKTVDESSPAGTGFLADTCQAWECEALRASGGGIRTVMIRIGFVIGDGGAMRLVLPVFRAGAGGPLGSGRQWMSCIHVEDVAGMILWSALSATVQGPVNAVMPAPVRNSEFTKTLAETVRRPAFLPAPAFALRSLLGDLSAVMLDSARVVPAVAVREGYRYRYPDIGSAFQSLVSPK